MKIRSVGAELFHADWQTDMRELIVAFRSFANAPKNDHKFNSFYTRQNNKVYQLLKLGL
jgi:hypothetical protein